MKPLSIGQILEEYSPGHWTIEPLGGIPNGSLITTVYPIPDRVKEEIHANAFAVTGVHCVFVFKVDDP